MHVWERKKNVETKLGSRPFLAPLFLQHSHQLLRCWIYIYIYFTGSCPVLWHLRQAYNNAHPHFEHQTLVSWLEQWIPSCEHIFLPPVSCAHWNGEEGKLESDFSWILAECWHRFPLLQCCCWQITALRIREAVIPFFFFLYYGLVTAMSVCHKVSQLILLRFREIKICCSGLRAISSLKVKLQRVFI